jgi:hypothetical protein
VAVGDPVKRVFDVYPHIAVAPQAYDESENYLTARSPDGKLAIRFETGNGTVLQFYAGGFDAVQHVEGCL